MITVDSIRRRVLVAMAATVSLGTLAVLAPDEEMQLRVVTGHSVPAHVPPVPGPDLVAAPPPPREALVYATRSDARVSVFRQPVAGGAPELLFAYAHWEGDRVGDGWASPPDVALSPDGTAVAYSARSGLRIRHLDTGADEVVISRRERHEGGCPSLPWWSAGDLNGTAGCDPDAPDGVYAVGEPQWSPDGRFLAFAAYWYEYQNPWVVELATTRVWSGPGSDQLAWAPVSDRVAVAGRSYGDPGELRISAPGDFATFTDLGAVVGGTRGRSYEDVTVHPDGQRLAIAYTEDPWAATATHLVLTGIDGGGVRLLDADGDKGAFAFGAGGDTLFFAEHRPGGHWALVAHDLFAGTDIALLPPGLDRVPELWVTPAGNVAAVGRTSSPDGRRLTQRLLLFRPDGTLVYESPSLPATTTFAGIH